MNKSTTDYSWTGRWIQTLTGTSFDFGDMSENVWDDMEVSYSLSRINRFTGHTIWPYTVAQHSVLVADRFNGFNGAFPIQAHRQTELRLAAILHDAAEAFVGDISSPLKAALKEHTSAIKGLEWKIWSWIASLHHLDPGVIEDIKREDLRAIATERRDLMASCGREWDALPSPWPEAIVPWEPSYAQHKWQISYRREFRLWLTMNNLPAISSSDSEAIRMTLSSAAA